MQARRPAIFLDRDGTIIEECNYLCDPDLVRLLPGVVGALSIFKALGFYLVVVTNQSGIARGYFGMKELAAVNKRVMDLLDRENIQLDAIYFCPHHEDGILAQYTLTCNCRKPLPGMWEQAAIDLCIDLKHSWTVGDKLTDLQGGSAAGTKVILVGTGYGSVERFKLPCNWPCVPDMAAVAEFIGNASAHGGANQIGAGGLS